MPGGDLILSVLELLFGGVSESKTSAVRCHARGARGPFAIHGHTSKFFHRIVNVKAIII